MKEVHRIYAVVSNLENLKGLSQTVAYQDLHLKPRSDLFRGIEEVELGLHESFK